MRYLEPTLEAELQKPSFEHLVKIHLTDGVDVYSYTKDRILDIRDPEEPWSQTAEVVLDNGDGLFTDLNLKGFYGFISKGAVTDNGEEYDDGPLLWVIAQRFNSSELGEHQLTCELSLIGIPNWLALDKASRNYIPDENDTKTIETLLTEIMGGTLGCFSHCRAWEVVFDDEVAGEAWWALSLLHTYKPKDSLRIYKGNSRSAIAKRLLGPTKSVMLAKADGKLHVFRPQITGTAVYTYSLASGHTFFSKAYRETLVIPNYIYASSPPPTVPNWVVVTSDPYSGEAKDQTDIDKFGERKDTADYGAGTFASDAECAAQAQSDLEGYQALHDDYFEGIATDDVSIAALATNGFNGEIKEFWQAAFENDDQARDVAIARLAKHTLNTEMGAAEVPLNVGAEVYDYIKVTDEREDKERKGTIGSLTRHYNWEEPTWRMSFSLGQRPKAVDVVSAIEEEAPYFGRLIVDNLYAKHILADSLDMVWLDPDNNIDLSKIGDTLDGLADGEVYARVKTLHLDAGQIKLDEYIYYAADYDPTDKFDLGDDTLDNIANGTTYERIRATNISAGNIKLTDQLVVDGEWYRESGVIIDATTGIALYGGQVALRTYPTLADYEGGTNLQCYVGTDGKLYAGAGAVILDASGIVIKGEVLEFQDANGVIRGVVFGNTGAYLHLAAVEDLVLAAGGDVRSLNDLLPFTDAAVVPLDIGSSAKTWAEGYINSLYIPTELVIPTEA